MRYRVLPDTIVVLAIGDFRQMRAVGANALRHRLDRKHIIDQSRVRRALWHSRHGVAVILSLREGQSAMLLHRGNAQGTVAPCPRQDDANGAFASILGQRLEEGVDRATPLARWCGLDDLEATVADCHRRIRRNYKDTVRFDLDAIDGLDHAHLGRPAKQFRQHAFVVGRQVLDQHERHAGIRRHFGEEAGERFKAAGGSAYANCQEHVWVTSI